MIVAGIDPGKAGAVVVYDPAEAPLRRLSFYQLPLSKGIWDPWRFNLLGLQLHLSGAERVCIEQCHAFPGISASANAAVMEAYGMWRVALAAHFQPEQVVIVPAAVWKKAMKVEHPLVKAGRKATAAEKKAAYDGRKQAALLRARTEFGLPFCTPKGRDMDGEAEAALIALYCTRI